MIGRAFESEWVKLRRRRLWYGSYAAVTGVVLLTTVVTIAGAVGHATKHGQLTIAQLATASGVSRGLTDSGILLGAVALSIAAAQFGGEFTHGTLRNLLVRQPRRTALLVGKGLAVLSFLVAAVAVATLFSLAGAFATAHLHGVSTAAWTSGAGMATVGTALGDLCLSVCGFALVGMILGVLLRSSVIAIATGLALLLPVETILSSAIPATERWLPGQLLSALASGGTTQAPFTSALFTVGAYLAAGVAVTMVVFARRDVTT